LSLQNFVIINCEEGIQLLFKKTIEITQNIKNYDNDFKNKELYVYDNKLYILKQYKEYSYSPSYIKISKFEFVEGLLEMIHEYEKTKIDDYNLKIMVMNDDQIFLLGKKIYMLNKCEK
jgi:hypothetical protein